MSDLEIIIGLNLLDISAKCLKRLLEVFGQPQDIIKASNIALRQIKELSQVQKENILSFSRKNIDSELSYISRHKLRVTTILDEDYPVNLKEIYDPPILIYVKGELKQDDKLSLAIVGSRQASLYGLERAEKFAFQLANLGLTIVSGMAIGIDTRAHLGALKANQRTIAVMGSGFNHIYPARNKDLTQRIAAQGAVISEFPCHTLPLPYNFPRRNRIISGLALGVLVVEAARNSGALITADFALEQGREVFSLPGKVDSFTSFGTHQLIKQGAALVTSVEDILEELNLCSSVAPQADFKDQGLFNSGLTVSEKFLYSLITGAPLSLDILLERSKLNLSLAMSDLLSLQLKGLIRQLPGKQFVRSEIQI